MTWTMLTIVAALAGGCASAEGWTRLPPLRDREGFAGSFAGVSGGALVVAGGANFPGKKPWAGGAKAWYDTIFVLEHPGGAWRVGGKLPRPSGYGVSATHGDSVICVGGSDAARHFAEAFRLQWTGETFVTSALPPLPRAVANGCGAVVGDRLYVAGGQERPDSTVALDALFELDLGAREPKWRELAGCPGGGRILAVAASFDGAFWLVGGAALAAGEGGRAERRYLTDAWRYRPGEGWARVADLPHPVVAAPSPAPADDRGFLVLGGDDGAQVGVPPERHEGFRRTILRFDARSGRWVAGGEMPAGRVTTPCVRWDGRWIVPSGEARPGVRSPDVWGLTSATDKE